MFQRLRFKVITAVFILFSANVSAQESSVKLGIRLGGGISVNPGIDGILVPEDYYSNYTFKDKWQAVPTAGLFIQYHKPGSILAAEGGIGYWQNAAKLVYDDTEGLHYTVTPRYGYLGVSAFLKVYPWRKGFNISAGCRAGAVLNEKGLSYESNQEDERFARFQFATTPETERIMKEKLTGRPDVAVGGGLGYEFGSHWAVDMRYFYGVTSTIKTETNDFNWIEKATHSHNVELSVSYLFDI